ncbi:MAG: serine/threonine-protein kinase, partial [Planctomycetota bacterium]
KSSNFILRTLLTLLNGQYRWPSAVDVLLEDLSSEDLRVLDEVCLGFETRFRQGSPETIDSALERYRAQASGVSPGHLELMRQELLAIARELEHASSVDTGRDPTTMDGGFAGGDGPAGDRAGGDSADSGGDNFDSIGPYSVSRVVARGGMGIVYKAFDPRLDRPVAIKVIGFPDTADEKHQEMVDRFEREARAVAALSHPNIVELFDVGTEDGKPYAVMEYLRGRTLAEDFRSGAMSSEQTRSIGIQVAGALATAHAGGVIHRDLKPQNIMVLDDASQDESIRVKLVDFGLSRVTESVWADDKSDRTRLGMILGTPGYMSPEQARGEPTESAADIFGLGCILYEAFFGRRAIPGDTPADRLAATLRSEVRYPDDRSDHDPRLCELIETMLQKDASQRPSADEVFEQLRMHASSSDSVVTETEFKRALGRRTWIAASVSGLIAGAAGLTWMSQPWSRDLKISSVAVLTFRSREEIQAEAQSSVARDQGDPIAGRPLDGRRLTDGEAIASAFVTELSRVRELAVRPFRPRVASSVEELQSLASGLGVDALVTGIYSLEKVGKQDHFFLQWEIVSPDGDVVASEQVDCGPAASEVSQRLVLMQGVARTVAKRMGHALKKRGISMGAQAYHCFVRGSSQRDLDSVIGLRKALMCFQKARMEGKNVAEPIGVFAVAAINLAARTGREEADGHVSAAIESMRAAIAEDPKAVYGLLAQAIIDWQIFFEFDEAKIGLEMLANDYPYLWEIQYQYGLLMATFGEAAEASKRLRRASSLNTSLLIKVDRCRVDWYFGDVEGALEAATRYRNAIDPSDRERSMLSSGLLIDIYEQQQRWDLAAKEQGWTEIPSTAGEYFEIRTRYLKEFPYGPFGELLNRAIFELRRSPELARSRVGELSESRSPMFPMLVNCHPAFASMRRLYEDETQALPPFLTPRTL